MELKGTENTAFIGELSLDGRIREINGVLPMIIAAIDEGYETIVIPEGNKAEAEVISNIKILPIGSINEVIALFTRKENPNYLIPKLYEDILSGQESIIDFSMIKGQHLAKRALEVAAAGGYNVLMIGPPGSGKTMLARAMASILPDLTFDEVIQVNKIHSIAGTLGEERRFITKRPFRDPHHTSSSVSLTGGGIKIRPGELSLAHLGVLFLDELPEFQRNVLEALRQPLEDGVITIARASGTTVFPARVMLIASMNPCPCRNYGSSIDEYRCTPFQIDRYLGKIWGSLLDNIGPTGRLNLFGKVP